MKQSGFEENMKYWKNWQDLTETNSFLGFCKGVAKVFSCFFAKTFDNLCDLFKFILT